MGEVLPDHDLYEILQVRPDASVAVIQAAYRTLMRDVHPDIGGDSDRAKRLNQARDVLVDPERRAMYDLRRSRRGVDRKEQEPHPQEARRPSSATEAPRRNRPRHSTDHPRRQTPGTPGREQTRSSGDTGAWERHYPRRGDPDFDNQPIAALRSVLPLRWVVTTAAIAAFLLYLVASGLGVGAPGGAVAFGVAAALFVALVLAAMTWVYAMAWRRERNLRRRRPRS